MTTYDEVNAAWGGVMLPPCTCADVRPIYRKLMSKFCGRKLYRSRDVTRVNRRWAAPRGTDTRIPHANGLPRMVHDASHWAFAKLYPGPAYKPHGPIHADIEKRMIEHVITKGWHLPKVAPPKPSPDQRAADELANTEARIKRWQTKAKRAATALRKLTRRQKSLAARLRATAAG